MAHVTMSQVDGGGSVPVDVAISHDDGVDILVQDAFDGEVDVTREFGIEG